MKGLALEFPYIVKKSNWIKNYGVTDIRNYQLSKIPGVSIFLEYIIIEIWKFLCPVNQSFVVQFDFFNTILKNYRVSSFIAKTFHRAFHNVKLPNRPYNPKFATKMSQSHSGDIVC